MRYALLRRAMTEFIERTDLARMLHSAATRIRENSAMLSDLDCATGDGDHGVTMARIAEQMELAIGSQNATCADLLQDTGWKILGVNGGAASSLIGTFFLGMSKDAAEMLDCDSLAGIFENGRAALATITKAQPGDKTMIDALAPAVAAFRTAAGKGATVPAALRDAARAARLGAESTAGFPARFGRAKFIGEKTLGHQDPGAVSIALLFEGFSLALNELEGD